MAIPTCGFKDSFNEFFDTEYEAEKSSFIKKVKRELTRSHPLVDWYTIDITLRYCFDRYNLLDRPTVPFWKKIV